MKAAADKKLRFNLNNEICIRMGKNIEAKAENIRYHTGTTSETTNFMFLLPRLIARVSQPDGNMTSFTLYFARLT